MNTSEIPESIAEDVMAQALRSVPEEHTAPAKMALLQSRTEGRQVALQVPSKHGWIYRAAWSVEVRESGTYAFASIHVVRHYGRGSKKIEP